MEILTYGISMNKTQLHPVIQKLFSKRGIKSENEIQEFLSWDLKGLPELTQMKDLEKAAQRLVMALESGEQIGVYGDYDVDGTTSCALLYHFFHMLGAKAHLFQPSRFVEGYGIHPSSIDMAIEAGVRVLISVDCGISNLETADYANEKDIDLIITDHHKDAKEHTPKAFAVVNPNRRDEDPNSELKYLAGVGVAFALALKIRELLLAKGKEVPSLYPLLQFVAIGTISDLAKLTPMNLKLVRHGLKQIPSSKYPGIRAFLSEEETKLNFLPSEKVSFNIGPLINSKGRLEHPEVALNLLISEDSQSAFELYSQLEICNRERKFIQAEVFKEAKEQVLKRMTENEPPIAIVYNPEWHEGVIGIVASKLVETFGIPALVFTNSEEEGLIKASVRTAGELDIFSILDECSDLFEKFGGHKAAAGLSMKRERLAELENRLTKLVQEIPLNLRTKQDYFDLEIDAKEIDPGLLKELEMLEPFGMGNGRPVFRMKAVKVNSYNILKDAHVRWDLSTKSNPEKKLRGISFFYLNKWKTLSPEELFSLQQGEELTAQFQLGLNRFKGNEYIQLNIEKIFN